MEDKVSVRSDFGLVSVRFPQETGVRNLASDVKLYLLMEKALTWLDLLFTTPAWI